MISHDFPSFSRDFPDLKMEFVKPPEPFAFEEPSAPQRWACCEKQFEMYFVAAELAGKLKEVQTAGLLNAAGADAQDIH